jgi:two-component system, chemotaxis family, chemotaxis protein CheY
MQQQVMIVDDSAIVRQQVGKALTQAGFQVIQATDGADALEKLERTPGVGLVVCDVNMPRMNGIEFLQNLSKGPIRVPVVMLTTEGQPSLIETAKSFGARAWIVKPFKAELLVAAVQKLLAA